MLSSFLGTNKKKDEKRSIEHFDKKKSIEHFKSLKQEYLQNVSLDDKIAFLHKNFPQDKEVKVDVGGAHGGKLSLIKTSSKYTFNNEFSSENQPLDLDLNFNATNVNTDLTLFINEYYDSNYNFLEELKQNDIRYSTTFGTYVFKYDKNKQEFSIHENNNLKNVFDIPTGKYFVFEPIKEDDLSIKGGKNKKKTYKKKTYKKKTYKKKKTDKRRRHTKRRR